MLFKRIEPGKEFSSIIECFWIIENGDSTPFEQKVIPDGFAEIIFHFGDPYRIQLKNDWQVQGCSLFAGQIRKYFLLENTGTAKILGIKLKPAAITKLYRVPMNLFTDKVVNLSAVPELQMSELEKNIHAPGTTEEKIHIIKQYFKSILSVGQFKQEGIDKAIDLVFETNGMVSIEALSDAAGTGERQLENLFKKYVGLSPNFFARIIRFNYIFRLAERKNENWTRLAYEAAYYDQSHFIRNFRAFTGERPSAYSFDEENMANFFLKKR